MKTIVSLLLLSGLLCAVPAGAAGPRIDLPVAFSLEGKAQDETATLYLKSELFHAKQADAPEREWELLGTEEHAVKRTGAPVQLFAAWVTANRPVTQQMLDGALYVRHTLSLRKPSGGSEQTLWRTVSANQRIGRVPFASHAEVADGGCAGNFDALNPKAKVTAENLSAKVVQGREGGAVASLTAGELDNIGSIELIPDLADPAAESRPAMAVPTLTVDGTLTFGTKDVELPTTGNEGRGLVPPGTIIAWARTDREPGPGWALCDGSVRSVCGRQVTLPNLDSRFLVGTLPGGAHDAQGNAAAYPLMQTGGLDRVSLTYDQMPAHTHTFHGFPEPGSKTYHYRSVTLRSGGSVWRGPTVMCEEISAIVGGCGAHENRPPFNTVRFYVKLP